MRVMKNNTNWIYDKIKPYFGERILEIGSGIGGISKCIASSKIKAAVLTDIKDKYLEYLKYRFIGNPKITIKKLDISNADIRGLKEHSLDTVVFINVLEHIKDDDTALKNIYDLLEDNGVLILLVPAFKFAYGTLDKQVEHQRRYEKKELIEKLSNAKFTVETAYYHNFISLFGWFVNSVVLRRKKMSDFQIRTLDVFVPILEFIEKVVKIPCGLSIIAIARKNRG
jgi:SAM-dependent methyltransferase